MIAKGDRQNSIIDQRDLFTPWLEDVCEFNPRWKT
jgi:hypothetical protein